jgi:hypothetical protein
MVCLKLASQRLGMPPDQVDKVFIDGLWVARNYGHFEPDKVYCRFSGGKRIFSDVDNRHGNSMQSKTFKVNKTLTSVWFFSTLAIVGRQNSSGAGPYCESIPYERYPKKGCRKQKGRARFRLGCSFVWPFRHDSPDSTVVANAVFQTNSSDGPTKSTLSRLMAESIPTAIGVGASFDE